MSDPVLYSRERSYSGPEKLILSEIYVKETLNKNIDKRNSEICINAGLFK